MWTDAEIAAVAVVCEYERRLQAAEAAIATAREALREAYSLIVRHHDCGKRIELGQPCPHCTDADGKSQLLDRIYNTIAALAAAETGGECKGRGVEGN